MIVETPPSAAPGMGIAPSPRRAPRSAPGRGVAARLWEAFPISASWVVLLALVGGPLVYVLLGAFLRDPLRPSSGLTLVGLEEAYTSTAMYRVLGESIVLAVVVGVISTAAGAYLAWTTSRVKLAGSRVRDVMIVAPLFLTPFVTTIAWVWLATPGTGVLDKALAAIHVPNSLQPNVLSTAGIVFVLVTYSIPYAYLFVGGAMQRADGSLEEASRLCGRGNGYTALRVLVPMLRGALLSSVLFIAILTLGEFAVPAVLDQRGAFTPFAVYLYDAVSGYQQNLPLAAALSSELMIVCLVGLYFYRRSVRSTQHFISVSGRRGASSPVSLSSRWSAVAIWITTALYALVTLVIPLVALVLMSLTSYFAPSLSAMHFSFGNLWSAVWTNEVRVATVHTVELAIVVPLVATTLGFAIVYLSERLKLRGAGPLSYLGSLPIAVPGIVMGTGLFLIYVRTPIYATLPLLGLGFVAAYVTHAIRLVGNGFHQIDPALEEASRICGASRGRTFVRVLAPLLRPSLLSAMVLIFVFTLRELSVAIVLYSPNSVVLSVLTWSDIQNSIFQAAAVGLVQMVLMVVGLIVLRAVFRVRLPGGRGAGF